jgi:hypothetical protein
LIIKLLKIKNNFYHNLIFSILPIKSPYVLEVKDLRELEEITKSREIIE